MLKHQPMTRNDIQQILGKLDDHEKRIRALELGPGTKLKKVDQTVKQENYSGATGGVRFLVKNGFFKTKVNQVSVRKELAEKGYHYSSQAIYEAMKVLARPGGPLVTLNEKGSKVYVERKWE